MRPTKKQYDEAQRVAKFYLEQVNEAQAQNVRLNDANVKLIERVKSLEGQINALKDDNLSAALATATHKGAADALFNLHLALTEKK